MINLFKSHTRSTGMFNGSTFWIENRAILWRRWRRLSRKDTVITEINNNLLYGWTLGWTPSTVGSYLCTRARPRAARARRATASEPRAEAATTYRLLPYTQNATGAASALGAACAVSCMCPLTAWALSVLARARVWLSGCMQAGRACSLRARDSSARQKLLWDVTAHVSSFSRSLLAN